MLKQILCFAFLFLGTAYSQLLLPKFKASHGPLSVQLGKDGESTTTSKTDIEGSENGTTSRACVCPSIKVEGSEKVVNAENSNQISSGGHTVEEVWGRQNEIMEMQKKTWEQVMRIADLVYAVQYGRRVIEITDNEQ